MRFCTSESHFPRILSVTIGDAMCNGPAPTASTTNNNVTSTTSSGAGDSVSSSATTINTNGLNPANNSSSVENDEDENDYRGNVKVLPCNCQVAELLTIIRDKYVYLFFICKELKKVNLQNLYILAKFYMSTKKFPFETRKPL